MKKWAWVALICAQAFVVDGLRAEEEVNNPWSISLVTTMDKYQDYLNGSDDVNNDVVMQSYSTITERYTSQSMKINLSYMYDKTLSFEASLPYSWKQMDRYSSVDGHYTVTSDGMKDVIFRTTYLAWANEDGHHIFAGLGVSLPTGSIDQSDDIPTASDQLLPYNMQLGSGTYDVLPELSYRGFHGRWGYGAILKGVVRTGKNSHGYRLGNQTTADIFGAYSFTDAFSTSLHLAYNRFESLHGQDSEMNAANSPEEDPNNQSGKSFGPILGLHYAAKEGYFKNMEADLLVAGPSWQDLDGPQLQGKSWIEFSFAWPF